jgi:hypothetical protein
MHIATNAQLKIILNIEANEARTAAVAKSIR